VSDRGCGREVVALLEACPGLATELSGELDVQLARLGAHVEREARVAEDLQHPVVGGVDDGGEGIHAARRGELGEVGE
jgi:hypothetical protein